jgi:hypothetical protein
MEQACVNVQIASWILLEGYYQVSLRWNDGVIIADNTYAEDE